MRYSWLAVLAGLPLITGAAFHPTLPMPPREPPTLVQGGFLDRLLHDNRPRRQTVKKRKAQRSSSARAAPALPAVIPVPIPKPGSEAQAVTEPSQQPAETPVPTPAPATESPAAPNAAPTPGAADTAQPAPASPPPQEPPKVEQPGTAAEPPHAVDVPTPAPKPEEEAPGEREPAGPGEAPAPNQPPAEGQAPVPSSPPEGETPSSAAPEGATPPAEQAKPEEPPPPPVAKEDPEELKACIADLTAIGGKFKEIASIDEGEGCGIDKPLEVSQILPGVEVGGAVMRCQTALSLSHWIKDTTQPALDIAKPGRKIVGLVPGSTYACRLRNGASTGKISEHARGNAFDVAAFKLDNGDTMEMKPRDDDHTMEGAFQKTATAGACLHFTTVLAPGSDAAHENHLHLDTMERENGYRICE
jgi:hypothetical protein